MPKAYIEFLRSDKYDIYEKLLFLILKGYAGNGNTCSVGQAYIAKTAGISIRKVSSSLKSLANKGIITIVNKTKDNNGKTINTYIVPMIDEKTEEFIY